MRIRERGEDRPCSLGGRFPLAARESHSSERRVRLGSPRWVAGQDAHELLGLLRGLFRQREQLLVGALDAELRRLQGEHRERLATRRGATLFRRQSNRSPQMLPHARCIPGCGAAHSACRLELTRPKRSGVDGRRLGGTIEPLLCLVDRAELQVRQREPFGCGELERSVSQETCVAVGLLAAGESKVGDDLRAREHLGAEEHLCLDRGAFALARERRELCGQSPDLLDPAGSTEEVDVDGEVDVGPGDDRRHHASTVADLVEQLDRALVARNALVEMGSDRRVGQDLGGRVAGGNPRHDRDDLAASDALHVPLPHPSDGDDSELAQRGREGGTVPQLLCQLARAPVRLGSAVDIHVARCAERLSEGALEQVLAELQARRQLRFTVAALPGGLAYRHRQHGGLVLFLGHAQRGGATQLDAELEVGVAQSLRQRGQLGEAFEPVGRATQHSERVVLGGEQGNAVLRGRRSRQRLVDDAQHLLRRPGLECRLGGQDGEAHGALRVAGGKRMMREEGQALGGRVAAGAQHVDDGSVDRAPALGGEHRRCELPDLVVREPVVRGRCQKVLLEQPRPSGSRQ